MKLRLLGLLTVILLAASAGVAHGNKKHVQGTIERVSAGSVVVKTADGKSVEVKLVPTTVYLLHAGNADKPAVVADLTAGERVVIHATPKGETLLADEVKFSPVSK